MNTNGFYVSSIEYVCYYIWLDERKEEKINFPKNYTQYEGVLGLVWEYERRKYKTIKI